MQLTGARIVLEVLKEQGVDTVFGYPGGTILNIYDALYDYKDEITHYLTSHEQGAAHAADGYARATGKVGVCFATSGPGATNLVTGIATAYMDSVPLVAITANVALPALGKDSFQEVDIAGVTMPITKHGFIVKDVNRLADTLRRAFKIASTGRPGPVLVDITKDVTANRAEFTPLKDQKAGAVSTKGTGQWEKEIEKAAELISGSKKPFIYTGGGTVISGASAELSVFAHKLMAPVCDTLMGKGGFDNTDPLYTGMIGMHGTKASNFGVSQCDLLIAIGARFSDRVVGNAKKFARGAKVIHIDIDPAEINKNVKCDLSIIGDVKEVLSALNERITQADHSEWLSVIEELKNRFPLDYDRNKLTCPYVIEKLYSLTEGNAIITTDVGQHQMWA
ncbi:MAG TPA: acetolactate synthase large subunit, partial [Lachnospiraceae bacterium]|nr:acetolactate synthase large subunit [Lachnospiraceae bacterium]